MHARNGAAIAAVLAVSVLTGCAGGGAPAPTVPELTYAGVPDAAAPSGPSLTPTAAPTSTAEDADDTMPGVNPAIDDVLQYAAIGGREITGEWRGGCRTTPTVGVSGMSWRGEGLAVDGGGSLATVSVEVSIRSTAADGTHDVESFSVHGAFADGSAFDASWVPEQQAGEAYGASSEGVSTLRFETPESIGSFELRGYCN